MPDKKSTLNLDLLALAISSLAFLTSLFTFYYESISVREKSLIRINDIDIVLDRFKLNGDIDFNLINHGNIEVLLESIDMTFALHRKNGDTIATYKSTNYLNEVVGVKEISSINLKPTCFAFWNPQDSSMEGLNAASRINLQNHASINFQYTVIGGAGTRATSKIANLKLESSIVMNRSLRMDSLESGSADLTQTRDQSMLRFELLDSKLIHKVDF
ncbi:MAG: hypothetical protein ABJD58_09320 [Cyclobacteriaceae bacterium]